MTKPSRKRHLRDRSPPQRVKVISELHHLSTGDSCPKWMCVPQEARVISDVQRVILDTLFPTFRNTPVQLLLDGTVLPPNERADIIRDEDILTIREMRSKRDRDNSSVPNSIVVNPSRKSCVKAQINSPHSSSQSSSMSSSSKSASSSSSQISSSSSSSASVPRPISTRQSRGGNASEERRLVLDTVGGNDPSVSNGGNSKKKMSKIAKIKRNRRNRRREKRRRENKQSADLAPSNSEERENQVTKRSVSSSGHVSQRQHRDSGILLRREKLINASAREAQAAHAPDFRSREAVPSVESASASIATPQQHIAVVLSRNSDTVHTEIAAVANASLEPPSKRRPFRGAAARFLRESQTNESVFLPAPRSGSPATSQRSGALSPRNNASRSLRPGNDHSFERDGLVLTSDHAKKLGNILAELKVDEVSCAMQLVVLGENGRPLISEWIVVDAKPASDSTKVAVRCRTTDEHAAQTIVLAGAEETPFEQDGFRYLLDECAISAMKMYVPFTYNRSSIAEDKTLSSKSAGGVTKASADSLQSHVSDREKLHDKDNLLHCQKTTGLQKTCGTSELSYEKKIALYMVELLTSVRSLATP